MYLKRLEIKGFKSFANNTEIYLKPGINIVVGPNGCGKSNVIDAVRWVLGESNIRNLRGQTYEDVIFNGSDNKKALGMATVEMTIDNSSHSLPVDYNEITTGRKVYRSGESEFYLNKTRVRLKDIINLFTGTGLGKKGYSIISQGELEQLLNAQGFERRLILEEASGIIKHRQQRDEVTRRIIATSNDLTRITDILGELENRKNDLCIKADKANTYLKISQEHKSLEKDLLTYELNKTYLAWRDKNEVLGQKKEETRVIRLEIEQKEKELKDKESEVSEKRSLESNLKEEKFTLENHINNLQAKIVLCEEKIRNCNERINSAADDENKYGMLLAKQEGDLKAALQDYQDEKQKYTEIAEKSKFLSDEINDFKDKLKVFASDYEKVKGQMLEQINRETVLKNQITEKEQNINRIREKKERLTIHIDEASEKLKAQKELLNQLEMNERDNTKKLNVCQETVNAGEEQNKELNASLQNMEQEYKQLNRDLMSLENKLISIKDMDKNYTGYSEGVRALLNSWKRGEKELKGIIGVIGDLIDVPAGMETAIDVAIGKGLENIVVEKADQAKKAIQYLKNNRLGRVTLLPLDILKNQPLSAKIISQVGSLEGVLGVASHLISFAPRFQKAVEYLLGRTLIVDNMDHALKVFKNLRYPIRIVTLEGDVINVSGAMSGGIRSSRSNSPLQRKNEEKKIKQLIKDKSQTADLLRNNIDNLHLKLTETEKNLVSSRNSLIEYQFQRDMLAREIKNTRMANKSCIETREKNVTALTSLDEQINLMEKGIAELESRFAVIKQENLQFSDEVEKNKAAAEIIKRDFEVRKERQKSCSDQLNMKKKELVNIEININKFKQVKKSYLESLEEAKALKERMNCEIINFENQIIKLKEELETRRLKLEEINHKIISNRENEKQSTEKANLIRMSILPRKNELMELESSIRNLEIHLARLETELEGMKNRWEERFNSEPPAACEQVLSSNREVKECKKRIAVLWQNMEEIGPVDVSSIQDYDEVKNKYEFMYNQYSDLLEAKDSLEKLLKETETLMVKNFAHFMILANESFNITFKQIFGGGEACLKLESGNKFDAGIEIVVKMPGKKHQSLNLLSGGERALTCIAFIFSLLKLRPAPFCLLDEIDAALDEVNLFRFADFVKEMSKEMQFIVITHRQVTIEAGDNIYGVTMPEEGVSTILTINYDEAESLAG